MEPIFKRRSRNDDPHGGGSDYLEPTDDQRHLELLLEAQQIAHIGSWERDLRTNQLWWSDECYRLFGYEPGSIAPSYPLFLNHIHAEDRDRVAQMVAEGVITGQPYTVEFRAIRKDGALRYFQNHCRNYLDERGHLRRTTGTTQDITARQQTKEELQRKTAYLQAVLANLPQGISVFDENLTLRVWNRGFQDVLGLPADLVHEGSHFSDLIRVPAERGEYGPGDPEQHVTHLTTLAARFLPHEVERTRANGRTHITQGQPLYIDGQIAGFVSAYTDITERKHAEERLRRQHDLLQTIIDNIPSGISLIDANLNVIAWNKEFLALLDLPETLFAEGPPTMEKLLRFNAERGEYGSGDTDAIVAAALERSRQATAHHFERTRPDGTVLEVQGTPLPEGGFVSVYTDISARKSSEERLRLADKVFANSPAGILITDENHRILSVNPSFSTMTGMAPAQVLGLAVTHLSSRLTPEDFTLMEETLRLRGNWSGEIETERQDGKPFVAGVTVSRILAPETLHTTHYVWVLTDVTEQKQAEERARHLAHHDILTGLPNRLALLIRLGQTLPEARRRGWNVGLMFIDLDRFKIINDTLGHSVGDDLLREVASRLAGTIRESDMVARLGGDEFVIVLPDISSAPAAANIAGKIITALSHPIQVDKHQLHTSPSIGISLFPADGPDGDTILRNADTAMYHAKAAGRNNYQFYAEEMNQAANERLHLENKLRQAVSRGEFALAFQPQFDARTRRPTGVEALIRWHHPEEGIISPDRFIPVAEETGLIVPIGEWVLAEACREVKAWQDAGLPPLRVAVNLSARQLQRRDFCETVAGALAHSGLAPELLELEITESVVMENPQEAIRILSALHRMGISLAIDDFGTGYSSLAYLKLFPIDHLKIDRSFVRDIETDLNDRAIAMGTIALAHSLGLNVIAEGVESEDQLEILSANGCNEIQGYLLSPPLNPMAAFSFLRSQFAAE